MTLNHYQTLEVPETATQTEIKLAYRRLAKQFHPDSQQVTAGHEQFTRINEAYEVLSDPQQRSSYDQWRQGGGSDSGARQRRTAAAQQRYRRQRQASRSADDQVQDWLNQVYAPIDRLMAKILTPLQGELRSLSADPFDDELMEGFQAYLEACRIWLEQAQGRFQAIPNPANLAGVAANLYHCLNQLEDGIEEMERFTYSYEESYLHTGQELFRISSQLRRDAKVGLKEVG